MPVTLVKRALPAQVPVAMTLGAVLMLLAGLAGATAPVTAVAIAAAVAAAVPGAALICLGLAVRLTFRGLGACRCAGMLGLGVLAGGVTAAILPAISAVHRAWVVATGLTVVAALSLVGLLYMPQVAATGMARLRLALDGLVVGALVAMAGWLVLPEIGERYRLSCLAAAIAVISTAIAAAAMLRAGRTVQREAMIGCGLGVACAVGGLALLVASLGREPSLPGQLAATTLVAAGPPMVWAGARRVQFASPVPGTAAVSRPATVADSSGFPWLALPVAAGGLAIAYHLLRWGGPDPTAVGLGLVAGGALGARNVLTASGLRRRARLLATQEAQMRALVSRTADVTLMLTDNLTVCWWSRAAHQVGLSDQALRERPLPELVHPDDAPAVVDRLRAVVTCAACSPVLVAARLPDGAGGWRDTEWAVSDLRTVPVVAALVVQVRDVGQRRQLERVVHLLASMDQGTGLPNGRELLAAITTRRAAGHRRGAVAVIALHGLTDLRDQRGRVAYDLVLREAARRLRNQVGAEDVPARLGGSQFAVVTPAGPLEAYALGMHLVAALTAPYLLPDRAVRLQVSIGLATLTGTAGEDLLRRGELAVRRAGRRGRNQVEWYDESLEEQLVRRLDLERHLPGAAGRGELDLVFQPVVELDGRRPVGVEALVRWRHPGLGRVLPGELMPIADQLRLSGEIGEWVLHAACQQASAWREAGHDLWLAVNATPRQLSEPDFVSGVAAALSIHETPPERLVIEVSAAAAVQDLAAVAERLSKVRGLGVRTALDDLGIDHPDLAWLRRLPLDMIKLATPPQGTGTVVAAVVRLARQWGLRVIAEGLEGESQRDLVRHAGCRLGQGDLFAPPAPADQFESYLDRVMDVDLPSIGSPSR